jgi:hypothetical protein
VLAVAAIQFFEDVDLRRRESLGEFSRGLGDRLDGKRRRRRRGLEEKREGEAENRG